MKSLVVNHKKFSYNIVVDKKIFSRIAYNHNKFFNNSKAFIITDKNVSRLYLSSLKKEFLEKKINFSSFVIKPGESSKSFDVLSTLSAKILREGVIRSDIIYALGGGIVGDLSGFLASIMLRGIKFIQIPTTLLSQVDSSVGGKTGINTAEGKNLIGSFHQPTAVYIDVATLSSLPKRDYLSGYAEVVKYALINDKVFFYWLHKNRKNILDLDFNTIKKIILKCCLKKSEIVIKDEKEDGIRMTLNLGHTFAHAIEAELDYKVLHGEAVAVGILMAMKLSYYLGNLKIEEYNTVENHFKEMRLPINLLKINRKKKWSAVKLVEKMEKDKKKIKNSIRFILCKRIGEIFIQSHISNDIIYKAIEDFI